MALRPVFCQTTNSFRMKCFIYKFSIKGCFGLALMAAILFSHVNLHAQPMTGISGTVTDAADGSALQGVTVQVKGSNKGGVTDAAGQYRLEASGNAILIFAYTGYARQEIAVNNRTVVNVVMSDQSNALDEVVVTGVVNPKSALQSSVSISTLQGNTVGQLVPRTTAEIFRSIPGIRSEASGGDGNTNITVRGVPIATGGSKFLQLHEDGLPVLQFGDIAFATADIFLRADQTVSRIEAIRGGSASTLASNSPAGIINLISKTGEQTGGSIGTTIGVDYNSFRTDFEYGSPIGNDLRFHVGGFFRQGDSPRKTGYTANYGGQIKANLTRMFENGYARIYFKYLNDRTPAFMPMPISVGGSNADPDWSSVAGYDAALGTLHSPNLLANIGTSATGELRRSNIADGMHPVSTAIGSEFSFGLGEGWQIVNRARMAFNKGRFVAPFPAEVGPAETLARNIAGADYQLSYVNGNSIPANQLASLNGNGLLMRIHLFDTELNNFNNFTNDLKITKSFNKVNLTLGYYKAFQNISMSWLWNSYLTDVTDAGLRLVNVANATESFTENGLLAYGVPAWGNCCHRNYDTQYDVSAPYAGVELNLGDNLNIDGSFRYDIGKVNGSYAGGDGQTREMDVNGDGIISKVEQTVATIDNANAKPVNYEYDYASFSIGANYTLRDNAAVFARFSRGGRANADRLLFTSFILPDGTAASGLSADMANQTEAGFKYKRRNLALNVTAFLASVEEQNYEATTQKSVNREYSAVGAEVEAITVLGPVNLRANFTYTKAEIKKDALNSAVEGNTPRRQADLIYNITPSVKLGKWFNFGLNIIGTTKSFAQDNNELVMPGYAFFNLFADASISKGLSVSLQVNNLTNAIGITEVEEGAITGPTPNVLRGRSILGRSITAGVRYEF